MTDAVAQELIRALDREVSLGLSSFVILFFVALAGSFAAYYLAAKAKNLATKEDIEVITDKIEQVKSTYTLSIENYVQRNRLALAALDKRLAAHQEAYRLWSNAVRHMHSDELHHAIVECERFWYSNCLYLGKETREEFSWCMHFLPTYRLQDPDTQLKWWERLMGAAKVIGDEVGLPPVNQPPNPSPTPPPQN